MKTRTYLMLTTLALSLWINQAQATVNVWCEPANATVAVGETVTMEIWADFSIPVTGWGLDAFPALSEFAAITDVAIGSAWSGSDTLDGDGLAGLSFPNGNNGVTLLTSITIEGLLEGYTPLTLDYSPAEDEGFLTESGTLDQNVSFSPTAIQVVPEPASVSLMLLSVLLLHHRRLNR